MSQRRKLDRIWLRQTGSSWKIIERECPIARRLENLRCAFGNAGDDAQCAGVPERPPRDRGGTPDAEGHGSIEVRERLLAGRMAPAPRS